MNYQQYAATHYLVPVSAMLTPGPRIYSTPYTNVTMYVEPYHKVENFTESYQRTGNDKSLFLSKQKEHLESYQHQFKSALSNKFKPHEAHMYPYKTSKISNVPVQRIHPGDRVKH